MIRRRRGRNARQQRQQSQQRPRMGVRHASRLDRLEEEITVYHDSAWQDYSEGVMPSPRTAAMLDWLEEERPAWADELRALVAAIPVGHLTDEEHLAAQAYARQCAELMARWEDAGAPDPRGRLDPRNRPAQIPQWRELPGGSTYH